MTYNEIFDGVVDCIQEIMSGENIHDNFVITADSVLSDDIGMTSLDKVRLQVRLEDKFLFSFDPFDDFDKIFDSVNNLCEYIFAQKGR